MRFALVLITAFLVSTCATSQPSRLVSGKIERIWSSDTVRYAEIRFNDKDLAPNRISYTVSEKAFGSLNPMPGDCVRVWFKQFSGSSIPHGNMNLVSCD